MTDFINLGLLNQIFYGGIAVLFSILMAISAIKYRSVKSMEGFWLSVLATLLILFLGVWFFLRSKKFGLAGLVFGVPMFLSCVFHIFKTLKNK